MKVIVFRKNNGTAIVNRPSLKYQNNIKKLKIPKPFQDLSFIILNESDVLIDRKKNEFPEMLYFDGDCKKENFKKDVGWDVCLMPSWLIAKKHLDNCESAIDAELEKDSPDPLVIVRHNRDIDHCKKMIKSRDQKSCYELALKNLDKRVERGESDKPIVREKIIQKLTSLVGDQ